MRAPGISSALPVPSAVPAPVPVLVGGAAAALGAAAVGRARSAGQITDDQARLIDKITAASAGAASLSDVKHIVILMQENRSFDHYFGTLSGVAGFFDPLAALLDAVRRGRRYVRVAEGRFAAIEDELRQRAAAAASSPESTGWPARKQSRQGP